MEAAKVTEPTKASLTTLQDALQSLYSVQLVLPTENEQKIRDANIIALRLLRKLRGEPEPVKKTEQEPIVKENSPRTITTNANITPDQQRQIDLATEQFIQTVVRVDNQILAQYIQAVQAGDYRKAEQILAQAQESQQTNTLMFALLTIGIILLPLYARQRIQALLVQFGLHTVFTNTDSSKETLRKQAEKGAKSHVQTIAKDLKNSLDDAIDDELVNPDIEAKLKEEYEKLADKDQKEYLEVVHKSKKIYAYARELILKGDTKQNVIKKLQDNFAQVSKRRAGVIAGNESNRVFTMSQFEADEQFLAQNKLTDKAYKRLVSNTGNPEPICAAIIERTAKTPIPFKQDFLKFGKEFVVRTNGKTYKFTPDYERLKGGHIHTGCKCRYELIIKRDDGTFINTTIGKVGNELSFEEILHPRDGTGKFSKKAVKPTISLGKLSKVSDFNHFIEEAYWKGTYGDYSHEVSESVRAYQGHYYDAINLHARAANLEQPLDVYGQKTTYQKTVENINIAGNIPLAEDTTLYRGTEIPFHQTMDVGDIIRSRSFLSTSVDKGVSDSFKYKGGSTLVITAKKDTNVILPDLVTFGARGRTLGEAEVLIPTNSAMKITRIDGDVVYLELL
jgi:hypothetical protein